MGQLEKLKPLALLLLRWVMALVYISHGYPKLFGQTANFMQFFSRVGLNPYLVYVVGVMEVFGGGLLILGLFVRPLGVYYMVEMSVAIWKVHLAHGIFSVRDYEFPLALAAAALTLAASGAGTISLDRVVFGKSAGGKRKV